ncbi:putative LuxR family transcriptional regulator [Actinacidiphila reveromycinica]|uniref:Putative LuxR family transcriptional regulator n=1 Tax=Actinacidiphila reveromycinica TaxID=659352 RepID=A0A7U3VPD6_9ACTN|nr:LuxR family transcriptional regulator [Streptomyces sp. SN-593]BBA98509.1 putative LuxR family transcriptional regulator [Streptomyces sp. SN-593]
MSAAKSAGGPARRPDLVPRLAVPRLAGRDRDLALFEQALDGRPGLVVVAGEAGIGKTRLLHELLPRRPETALVAVCPPFREPYTLGPVVDAVRRLAGSVAGLPLTGLAGALRPLFPEWAEHLPPAPEPLPDDAAARHRLLRALAELVDALGVGLFVVEDAHWADETTLELLLLLRARWEHGPRLVLTYRPEDVRPRSPLRRLVAQAGVTRLEPAPLDTAGTADLVSSMLGGEPVSVEFAEFLRAHTDGLPLAIEESVRLLHDRADLVHEDGAWLRRDVAELDVPPGIREAVLERISRLRPAVGRALAALAVLEGERPPALVAEVAGAPPADVSAGLAEALAGGLLQEDREGRVSFRHVLAARSVYHDLGAAERGRLHRRAGRALEREPVLRAAELARHFREAGDPARWAAHARRAADDAIASGDPRTAFGLLLDLLVGGAVRGAAVAPVVQRMPLYAAPGDDPLRALVAVLRETAAGELGDEERTEATWQLARLMFHVGDPGNAAAAMERAVPGLVRDRPVAAVHAMMMLARPLGTTHPAARHRAWLERAGRLSRTCPGSPQERLSFLMDRAATLLVLGDPAGWAAARDLPDAGETPGELLQRARGFANLGEAAMLWGRYDEARRLLDAAAALAEEHRHLRLRDLVGGTLAHLDWLTGGWTGLGRWAATALDAGEPVLRADALLLTGQLDAARGRHREAAEKTRSAAATGRPRGPADGFRDPSAVLARLALAAGRPAEALAATDAAWRLVEAKGLWLWAAEIAPPRVRALLQEGRAGEAADAAGAFAAGTRGLDAPMATAARLLAEALLARDGGEPLAAAGLFEEAAAAWEVLPRPYDALLAREAAARCRLAAGPGGPAGAPAVGALREVFAGLTALGAAGDAERVRGALAEAGARVGGRAGRPGYGDRLSPRELDVVRLLVEGRTSAQIARVLGLSPRTVEKHVQAAMRKRGAPSRTALAVAAVESGDVPPAARRRPPPSSA